VFSIPGCREQGDALRVPLLSQQQNGDCNKATETEVNKAERTVRCICSMHDVSRGLEGTTHDPSVLQETSQFHGSRHATTNVTGISFSRSSKGAKDVRNAFNAHFNGPTAATPSQNQQVYCDECSL